jgi:hypothetical protein
MEKAWMNLVSIPYTQTHKEKRISDANSFFFGGRGGN